jgi:hypothetical protein
VKVRALNAGAVRSAILVTNIGRQFPFPRLLAGLPFQDKRHICLKRRRPACMFSPVKDRYSGECAWFSSNIPGTTLFVSEERVCFCHEE